LVVQTVTGFALNKEIVGSHETQKFGKFSLSHFECHPEEPVLTIELESVK